MIIYIDGTPLARSREGIRHLAEKLIVTTAQAMPKDSFTILLFKGESVGDLDLPANAKVECLPFKRKPYTVIFKLLWRPSVDRWLNQKPDVTLYLNFVCLPFIKGSKKLVFVHDLVYLDMPETVEHKNLKYLSKFVPWSISVGAQPIAISNYFVDEIKHKLGVKKVDLVHPGSTDLPVSKASLDSHPQIKPGYILYVGALQPRKNIINLIDAYMQLQDSIRAKHQLVLVGRLGWNAESIKHKLELSQQADDNIKQLGFVDDKQLTNLYANALMLAFPSFYEGFGMPVVYAQVHGTPVITAKNTGLVDAAGKAALFVDPNDTKSISQAMYKLIDDDKLRARLAAEGKINAKRFSWEASGRKLAEIIKESAK